MLIDSLPIRLATFIAIACLPIFLYAQDANETEVQAEEPTEAERLEELIADLEGIMKRHKVPGAGVAIVRGDEEIFVGGLGMADVELNRNADSDTLWRIGSISKMFVALSALKLEEEGVWSLDDPIVQHAPELPYKNRWSETHPITIAHLLEHSSGFDDLHMNEYAHQDPNIGLEAALRFNPRGRKSRWPPGEYATYSNANPPIVAYAAELKTGMLFEEYVEKNFFDPIGMRKADYFLSPDVEKSLAIGYQGSGKNQKPVDYWHIIMRPSGSINASAKDMARFVQFLLNRGEGPDGRLLSEASLRRMETTSTTLGSKAGSEYGYGLNNYDKASHGWKWQGHNGGMMGYLADLSYLPEQGVGYAVMVNKSNRGMSEMSSRIARFLADGLPEVPEPEYATLSEEELNRFVGLYRPVALRQQNSLGMMRLRILAFETEEGELKATTLGKGFRLKPAGDNRFYRNAEKVAQAVFFENFDGEMSFQMGGLEGMKRVSPTSAFAPLALAAVYILTAIASLIILISACIGFLIRKIDRSKAWSVRLMPSAANATLVASQLIMVPFLSDPFAILGTFTWVGLLSYLLSWAQFGIMVLAAWLFYNAIRKRMPMKWYTKGYLFLACLSGLLVNAYLFYWNSWLPPWVY